MSAPAIDGTIFSAGVAGRIKPRPYKDAADFCRVGGG
jgi:hypothetical protein